MTAIEQHQLGQKDRKARLRWVLVMLVLIAAWVGVLTGLGFIGADTASVEQCGVTHGIVTIANESQFEQRRGIVDLGGPETLSGVRIGSLYVTTSGDLIDLGEFVTDCPIALEN